MSLAFLLPVDLGERGRALPRGRQAALRQLRGHARVRADDGHVRRQENDLVVRPDRLHPQPVRVHVVAVRVGVVAVHRVREAQRHAAVEHALQIDPLPVVGHRVAVVPQLQAQPGRAGDRDRLAVLDVDEDLVAPHEGVAHAVAVRVVGRRRDDPHQVDRRGRPHLVGYRPSEILNQSGVRRAALQRGGIAREPVVAHRDALQRLETVSVLRRVARRLGIGDRSYFPPWGQVGSHLNLPLGLPIRCRNDRQISSVHRRAVEVDSEIRLGAALLRRRSRGVQEGLRAAWQELLDPAKAG